MATAVRIAAMETRLSFTISACTKSCPLIGSMDTCLPFIRAGGRLLLTLKGQHRPGVLSSPRVQDAWEGDLRTTDNSDNRPDNHPDNRPIAAYG